MFYQCCNRSSRTTIDDTLSAARSVLDAANPLLSLCPIPGLQAATGSLSFLIQMLQATRGNEDQVEELADNIRQLATIIQTTIIRNKDGIQKNEGDKSPPKFTELEERVTTLVRNLDNITSQAGQLNQGWFLTKCFHSQSNADTLSKLNRDLQNAIRNFSLQGQLTVEMLVISDNENKKRREEDEVLERLLYANARYSSSLNPTTSGTLEGTRTGILDELTQWTSGPDQNGYDPLIFIVSGGAGTGKSTIAFEMAGRLDNANTRSLGASFFFVRGAEKLSTTRHVLPTLVYQLAASQPNLRPHLVNAVREYVRKGKHGQQLEFDLKDLIIDPLKNVTSHHRVIIILDALDECTESSQDDIVLLLYLFMQYLPTVPFPLRILVTTRPEMRIEEALDSVEFRKISKPFRLQDIPMTIVSVDIAYFLRTKMGEMRCWGKIRAKHPDVILALTERAAGLFIYAATVIRAVGRDTSYGVETIDAILSDDPQDSAFSLKPLDKLYLTVLQQAFSDEDLGRPDIGQGIQVVLGSLALLQDRVSTAVLGDLLCVDIEDAQRILSRLKSVIITPKNTDGEISMLHASFPQFLIDERRCNNPTFYISPATHHTRLAVRCLKLMTMNSPPSLNIRKIADSLYKTNSQDLQEQIKKHMPPHLQYACLYWASHLSQCEATTEILNLVEKFTMSNLLAWIEISSYLGRLQGVVASLVATLRWLPKDTRAKNDVHEILNNAYRLVLEFYTPISAYPSELYNSALTFSPSCKLIKLYAGRNGDRCGVEPLTDRDSAWGPCLRTIETGHREHVWSLAFSPDRRFIASGLYSGMIQIWDSGDGTLKTRLVGQPDRAMSLSWAPDGRSLVSSCYDSDTIRVWNVASGAETYRQDVIGKDPKVSWNADGKRIVSMTERGGMQVWNLTIGKGLELVKTVPELKMATSTSKDLMRVLYVAKDTQTLRLWDVEDGIIIHEMRGHTPSINSAEFLHDETQIASGTNKELMVWDVESGKRIYSRNIPTHSIVASSSEDVVVTCDSQFIYLWDAHWECRGQLAMLPHSCLTSTISISPDGQQVVSPCDASAQLWDLSQPIPEAPSEESKVNHVIFSPDGLHVVASTEKTVSIWSPDTHLGEPPYVICGSSAAAFSPDSQKLAVIDQDKSISFWDLTSATPTILRTLPTDMEWNTAIAWSPDGHRIASLSGDTLWILDTATGQQLQEIKLNLTCTLVFAVLDFSSDGTMIFTRLRLRQQNRSIDNQKRVYKWEGGEKINSNQIWDEKKTNEVSEQKGWIVRSDGFEKQKLCWMPAPRRGASTWQGSNYFAMYSRPEGYPAHLSILRFKKGFRYAG